MHCKDSNFEWNSGKKMMVVFFIFQLVSVKKVTTVYPLTWNPVLAVILLLLFKCGVTVDILSLGC